MGQLMPLLRTNGTHIETDDGERVLYLKGVGLGGWMNMENFITGYPANEELMRSAVARVLGEERSAMFFDRLLQSFFGPADADLLAGIGLNHVRLPINYRHFEDDESPFEIKEEGFRHLDRVIDLCAEAGLLHDHRPARCARLAKPPLALGQRHPCPALLAAPPIPRPGRASMGGPGGALQGPSRGWRDTTSSTSRLTRRMSG